jgi:synaptobrevin family protein YKT6
MIIYAINVFFKGAKPVHKKASYELSSFGFFQRSGVREFMTFTSDLLVERTNIGERQSVKEQEYICHVYANSDCLAAVVVTDMEYPSRVVFTLINKILDQFATDYPRHIWPQPAAELSYPALDSLMKKYQDPKEADPLMKVQNEIDETKIVLHETIDAVLRRGEKLDDLVQKTDMLSGTSKAFYKESKGSTCCSMM